MAALVVLAAGFVAPGGAAEAAEWEWTLAPYFWGAGVKMDVEANDEPVLNSDVSFGDLLDKTDMAGMVHFEGRNGKWGFLFDALYMALSDDFTTSPRPPLPGGTDVDADLSMLILEGGGFWRLSGDTHGFDLLFGVRVLQVDPEVELDIPAPFNAQTTLGDDQTFTDAFVGGRYSHAFAKRWDFAIRGDVGTGDTDLTWNAIGTMGVQLGDSGKYSVRFGYRQMEMNFENDGDVKIDTDITMSGPIAGFVFHW